MDKRMVLVVEDDPSLRKVLALTLESEGYEVARASTGGEALTQLEGQPFDLILLDLGLPDVQELELLRKVRARWPRLPIVVATGRADARTAVKALKLGAQDYLTKPVGTDELVRIVAGAMAPAAVPPPADVDLITGSPEMDHIRATLLQVAPTDSSVLIEGETGTGKERIASAIHRHSRRSARPFVAVNCAAIAPELLESEFFGHAKGAFTGAVSDTPGLFRAADGGTLFLDELTELPVPLQAKLLRVIQEREVRSVGSTKDVKVDVRIVAASSQSFADAVKAGRFRPELFYRLNVVCLHVPPLRQRKDALPSLIAHFIERFNRRFGRAVPGISPSALAALRSYEFPGNVRELEHLIERAFALGAERRLEVSDFPIAPGVSVQGEPSSLAESAGRAERDAIVDALRAHNGDREKAAEVLGVSRRTLYRRMKEFGLLDRSTE